MYRRAWAFSVLLVAFFLLFSLVACSNTEEANGKESDKRTEQEDKTDNGKTEQTEDETDQEKGKEEDDTDEVSFEVVDIDPPEDQGDLNVWLAGDFEIVDDVITVKGTTNLLPGSTLFLNMYPEDGAIIGGDGYGTVEDSGVFEIEGGFPEDFEGLLHMELIFNVGNQTNEEVKNHYAEEIKGDFAKVYYSSYDETFYSGAAFHKTVLIDGEPQSFSITKPEWNFPEDQGNQNIWIKPTIDRFEDYLVIQLESNLLDDIFVGARANIPNYITTGFSGSARTNPDGSATIYIEDPEKDSRIKDLSEYTIEIEVDPGSGDNEAIGKEVYGANGEKFTGDLVKEKDEGKKIVQELKVTVQ